MQVVWDHVQAVMDARVALNETDPLVQQITQYDTYAFLRSPSAYPSTSKHTHPHTHIPTHICTHLHTQAYPPTIHKTEGNRSASRAGPRADGYGGEGGSERDGSPHPTRQYTATHTPSYTHPPYQFASKQARANTHTPGHLTTNTNTIMHAHRPTRRKPATKRSARVAGPRASSHGGEGGPERD